MELRGAKAHLYYAIGESLNERLKYKVQDLFLNKQRREMWDGMCWGGGGGAGGRQTRRVEIYISPAPNKMTFNVC